MGTPGSRTLGALALIGVIAACTHADLGNMGRDLVDPVLTLEREATDALLPDTGAVSIFDVVAGPSGWLALGSVTEPDGSSGPVAVSSVDGGQWQVEALLHPTDANYVAGTAIVAVAGSTIVGYRFDDDGVHLVTWVKRSGGWELSEAGATPGDVEGIALGSALETPAGIVVPGGVVDELPNVRWSTAIWLIETMAGPGWRRTS